MPGRARESAAGAMAEYEGARPSTRRAVGSLSDACSQKPVRAQGAPLGLDDEPPPLYSAANLSLSKVHFRFQT